MECQLFNLNNDNNDTTLISTVSSIIQYEVFLSSLQIPCSWLLSGHTHTHPLTLLDPMSRWSVPGGTKAACRCATETVAAAGILSHPCFMSKEKSCTVTYFSCITLKKLPHHKWGELLGCFLCTNCLNKASCCRGEKQASTKEELQIQSWKRRLSTCDK